MLLKDISCPCQLFWMQWQPVWSDKAAQLPVSRCGQMIANCSKNIEIICEHTLLTKMSSPSSTSPSAMLVRPAPGSSVAGKGGRFRSELAAIFSVVSDLWRRRKWDTAKRRGSLLQRRLAVTGQCSRRKPRYLKAILFSFARLYLPMKNVLLICWTKTSSGHEFTFQTFKSPVLKKRTPFAVRGI